MPLLALRARKANASFSNAVIVLLGRIPHDSGVIGPGRGFAAFAVDLLSLVVVANPVSGETGGGGSATALVGRAADRAAGGLALSAFVVLAAGAGRKPVCPG